MKWLLLIYSMNMNGEFTQKVVAVTNSESECAQVQKQASGGQKLPNKFYACFEVKQ